MRKYTIPQPMTVEYFLGDHLGSTGITTDTSGAKVSEIRYKAWGEIRYSWTSGVATTPTYKLSNYTFTGQYSYMDDPTTSGTTEGFGLMFYNARWYDPVTGRFTQPDSLMGFDRYQYANNSPLVFIDPSGHVSCVGDNFDDGPQCKTKNPKVYSPSTSDDFENMSWRQRKDWLASFAHHNGLGDWFNDMISAIDFMMGDSNLSAEGGTAEVMDAAVLQAINDGWLISQGKNSFGDG